MDRIHITLFIGSFIDLHSIHITSLIVSSFDTNKVHLTLIIVSYMDMNRTHITLLSYHVLIRIARFYITIPIISRCCPCCLM